MQFNFNNLCKSIISLDESANESNPLHTIEISCTNIKNELNAFCPDFRCKDVIFSKNMDKQFFGIYIRPIWDSSVDFAKRILAGYTKEYGIDNNGDLIEYERFKPASYILEIDGRLFRDFNLSPIEICAILVKEIILMNSAEPVDKLRGIIDTYITMSDTTISSEDIQKTASLFELACTITIHNITCAFCDITIDSDNRSLTEYSELTVPYKTAMEKIWNVAKPDVADTRAIMINWYFTNYKQFSMSRDIQYTIKNCLEIEASNIIKTMLLVSLKSLENISYNDERYYRELISESTKKRGLLYQMKRNGLRSIEEDLFEYNMRLRNVETQDDAILLMRQINSRMSILEEYLDDEDLDEKERKRWEDCYKKYLEIRDSLSKKTVYNKKMYGLFVDYNALQNMSQAGNLMNTYY